nr:TolC family protein [Bryobacter sp.]
MRKSVVWGGLLLALPALPQSLTLKDAVRQAARSHPAVEAAQARIAAAQTRPNQAKAGWMPQVNYQESVMRSNNPVFVFGSLLNQRRFSADRFQIDKLNNPEFVNNFQSLVSVDQNLYDFNRTRKARDLASTGVKLSEEEKRRAEQAQMAAAARAWLGVVLAREAREVAREGVRSAEADLARAEAVLASGRSTDADVLSVKVHLEMMRDIDAALPPRATELKELESTALAGRSEIRQSLIAKEMAGQHVELARANRLPVIGARMAFEADRGTFATQVGANWMFAASLKWNLFDGNQTSEKVREATAQ